MPVFMPPERLSTQVDWRVGLSLETNYVPIDEGDWTKDVLIISRYETVRTMYSALNRLMTGLILVAAITMSSGGIASADTRKEKKEAVARVNGDFITESTYKRQLGITQHQFLRQGVVLDEEGMKRLEAEVLESLIDNQLLFQVSIKRGYGADEQEVKERFEAVKAQFQSEKEFMTALEEMQYTEGTFKDAVERRVTLEKLIDNDIVPKVTVSDEESRQYYEGNPEQFVQPEQVRARHILIIVEDWGNEQQKMQALEEIKTVQQKLKAGEDFAALAREYSEGPSNVQGGDLGFFGRGEMVEPFEVAAFSMKIGEVSDIVETRFGYHLIEVTDIRTEVVIPYEYAKDSIDQYIAQNKVIGEIEALVKILKDEAEIERFPENM